MIQKFMLSLLMTLFSSSVLADVDLNSDLSGLWSFTASHQGKQHRHDLVVSKSELKFNTEHSEKDKFIYQVSGTIPGMNIVGLSIDERDGKKYLQWLRLENHKSKQGTRFGSTFNLIIKIEGDSLVLGTDYEDSEIARLTKTPLLIK